MVDEIDSPLLTPHTPALLKELYFTVDTIEGEMGSNWPSFPVDYLESRRETIYNQIHHYDLNIDDLHEWLLDRGPWVSKEQLEDALRNWIDEEPMNWRPLPDLDQYTTSQALSPMIDDLLEGYGNSLGEKLGGSDGRDDGYDDPEEDRVLEDDLEDETDENPQRGSYGSTNDRYDVGKEHDGRDKYDGGRGDDGPVDDAFSDSKLHNPFTDANRVSGWQNDTSGGGYGNPDDLSSEEGEGKNYQLRSSNPETSRPNPSPRPSPAPPRTSLPGLGQTMASKYEPGLKIRDNGSVERDISKHRTYNFFESFRKPDSPSIVAAKNAPFDPGAPTELKQAVPSRPKMTDRSQDFFFQFASPWAMGGGIANDGAYGEWADDEQVQEERIVEQKRLKDLEELARQEKEDNELDWQLFMQAVKLGS